MQNEVDTMDVLIEDAAKGRMEKAVESLSNSLLTLRAGRANPHVLDRVSVDYYGVPTPLSQVASISAPEARLIVVQPFDPSQIMAITKAILKSNLGFNPNNDGRVIRINVPPLNDERRQELAKQARQMGEEAKVSVRNARRKAVTDLKKAEKDSDITEDDLKQSEKDVQDMTDKYIKKIDDLVDNKSKEIFEDLDN